MNKLEQAARQALLYLEAFAAGETVKPYESEEAITALREALAEQAEQEPVAEVITRPLRGDQSQPTTDIKWLQRPTAGKLYAAPVRTKDLTDDEERQIITATVEGVTVSELAMFKAVARAVIAADRELNK